MGVPEEGADAELEDGEVGGGVAELEEAHVGAVTLEGFAPRRAGDAAHLGVHGDELRVAYKRGEALQGGGEVHAADLLHLRLICTRI